MTIFFLKSFDITVRSSQCSATDHVLQGNSVAGTEPCRDGGDTLRIAVIKFYGPLGLAHKPNPTTPHKAHLAKQMGSVI